MPDLKTRKLSLTFTSELATVERIESLAETWAADAGFPPDTCSQIAMCSREAAINAVLHGNRQDPAKPVAAAFELSSTALSICVADHGEGMDPDRLPDPSIAENLLRSSGRGVFLMRALMDEVRFRQLNPGLEVTLVKHRAF